MSNFGRAMFSIFLALIVVGDLPFAKMYRPPVSFATPAGDLSTVDRKIMPFVDVAALLAEDEIRDVTPGTQYRFAQQIKVHFTLQNSGSWEDFSDGSRLWRLRISSPGAKSLNLAFSLFEIPVGGGLWVYNVSGDHVEGPYTAKNKTSLGEFWTPVILGEEIVVEVYLPADVKDEAMVEISFVHHGYRIFGVVPSSSLLGCEINIACRSDWQDESRSVALVTIGGNFACTGTLLNKTSLDFEPLFLTAWHCFTTTDPLWRRKNEVTSMNFYWNFEFADCIPPSGATPGPAAWSNTQSANFLAEYPPTDSMLVRLQDKPDPAFDVFYSGWKRSDLPASTSWCDEIPPGNGAGIHHVAPNLINADVKTFSFDFDSLSSVDTPTIVGTFETDIRARIEGSPDYQTGAPYEFSDDDFVCTHWQVGWDEGITKDMSSGSGLWDPLTHYLIGKASTSSNNSCPPGGSDKYGKFSVSWNGGKIDANCDVEKEKERSLRCHLDPGDYGDQELEGANPPTTGVQLILLLDRTGSMMAIRSGDLQTRCRDALEMARLEVERFFATFPDPGSSLAVWTFSGVEPADLTGGFVDETASMAALNSLDPEGCDGPVTILAEVICEAADFISTVFPSTARGAKRMVISSDALENFSDGECSGFWSTAGENCGGFDTGSWQEKVCQKLELQEVVVDARLWTGAPIFATSSPSFGIDMETGSALHQSASVSDSTFFAALAGSTGGSFQIVYDFASSLPPSFFVPASPSVGIPTLSEWGLSGLMALFLMAGIFYLCARRINVGR